MKNIINSPIFITVVVLTALFIFQTRNKPTIASEIEAAYNQLITIAEDAGSDPSRTQAIHDFAQQISTQIREGFSAGFSSPNNGKETDETKFLRVKEAVIIEDLKEIPSQWDGPRQAVLFSIKNQSDYSLTQIRVNLQYYKNGDLIDVNTKHLHEIRVLGSGESVSIKEERVISNNLTDTEKEAFMFDEVRALVTSFRTHE